MAKLKISVGRTDVHHINMDDLHIDDDNNGRHFKPSNESIRALALDICEHGQLQPIVIRKIAADTYAPVAGFSRCRAINLINSDPELRVKAGLAKGSTLPVKCVTVQTNEQDALLLNISENAKRNQTSPIDDAHNQERLRRFGWSNVQIAEFYGCTPARISQLADLLMLSRDHQRLVHDRAITQTNGIDLASLMPDVRESIVEKASEPFAPVDHEPEQPEDVIVDNKKVREEIQKAKNKPVGRTLKQAKDDMLEIAKTDSGHSYGMRACADVIYCYLSGESTLEELLDEFQEQFDNGGVLR